MSESTKLLVGESLRARVILMLADGRKYGEIQERLGTSAPTISRWKKRFIESGIQGLLNQPSSPKRSGITPELREKVITATWRGPGDDAARWSCRSLAKELGISKDIVHRIWRSVGLRPHRLDQYPAESDNGAPGGTPDIIGVYLDSIRHIAVFCTRKLSERLAESQLPSPSPEQQFPGRLSLLEVLSATSGLKPVKAARARSAGCIPFLRCVLNTAIPGWQLNLLVKRLNRDDAARVQELMESYPNAVVHFESSRSAWLSRIEEWFSNIRPEAASTMAQASFDNMNRKLMRQIRKLSRTKKAVQWVLP